MNTIKHGHIEGLRHVCHEFELKVPRWTRGPDDGSIDTISC